MTKMKLFSVSLIFLLIFSCAMDSGPGFNEEETVETAEEKKDDKDNDNVIQELIAKENLDSNSPNKVKRYEKESNNSRSKATRFYDDDNVYGRISSKSDVDYYKIKFKKSGKANFYLGKIPSGCDYDLYLYNSSGSKLKRSTRSGNKDELISKYSVKANRYYYLKVKSYKGSSSSRYKLRAKLYGNTDTFSYDNIKKVIEDKGYRFFEGDYNVNLVGIRIGTKVNEWDDYFCVLYQVNGRDKIKIYKKFTVDPGYYYLQKKLLNSRGCAIVVPGQYRGLWQIGKHKGKYKALVQKGKIKVYRDKDKDDHLDMKSSTIHKGYFGINLHHGNDSSKINKYSAGCQVFQDPDDLTKVLDICDKAKAKYGNSFTYTLLDIDDLE